MKKNNKLTLITPESTPVIEIEAQIVRSRRTLEENEALIETYGLRRLEAKLAVARCLSDIKEHELYVDSEYGGSWEEYCRERWGMSDSYAGKLIEWAEVIDILPKPDNCRVTLILPNESVTRPLRRLPFVSDKIEAWESAVRNAHGTPTARDVEESVQRLLKQSEPSSSPAADNPSPKFLRIQNPGTRKATDVGDLIKGDITYMHKDGEKSNSFLKHVDIDGNDIGAVPESLDPSPIAHVEETESEEDLGRLWEDIYDSFHEWESSWKAKHPASIEVMPEYFGYAKQLDAFVANKYLDQWFKRWGSDNEGEVADMILENVLRRAHAYNPERTSDTIKSWRKNPGPKRHKETV